MNERTGGFSIKKLLFGRIRRKLILAFLLVGIIPLTVLGLVSINLLKESLNKEISDGIVRLAEAKEGQVYAYLDSLESRTVDFSSDALIKDALARMNRREGTGRLTSELNQHLIVNKKPLDPTIAGLFVMDANGRIVASTDAEEVGKNESKDEYFIEGMKGPFLSELSVHQHFNLTKTFISTAPITDAGKLLGVIAILFNVDKLNGILSGQFQLDEGAVSGRKVAAESLDIYLVDKENIMLVHPYNIGEYEFPQGHSPAMTVNTLPVEKCTKNNAETVGVYDNYAGKSVIGASMCFPKQGWTLLTEIEAAEAFAPINLLQRILAAAALAFVFLTLLIAIAVSETISRPIRKLHKVTEEVEKGNFNARIDIRTGDELQQLGTAFNRATEALGSIEQEHRQMDHAKTEFLSITSHELRSPMTPMKAQLQMLLKGYFGRVNAKQKESLDIVLRNTARLDSIIMDFLEISRIEAARLKFKFVKTNLETHINCLVKEMQGFLPEKKIRIVANVGKLPAIEVDPDRVMQVLRNLLNNAKKFSSNNSKIFLNAELKGSGILFSVKDSGIGISSESQQRIFEPFFQEERTMYRKYGGTGLGLAICRGIVEAQNGKIWLTSQKGKGSAFYFTFPLKPVKAMKPIKLLFSQQENIEKKVNALFVYYLGAMGEIEFNELKKKGLKYEDITNYVSWLMKQDVLTEEKAKKFRKELNSLFGKTPEMLP